MKYNSNIARLFLDLDSKYFTTQERVDIILSPSLYWVKKQELPVKSIREAKKLLPSIFEDILPDGNYNYYAYKQENYFYLFAYDNNLILKTLKDKEIPISMVRNIYFAQSELYVLDHPISLNENKSMIVKDSIVSIIPSSWIDLDDNNINFDISTIELSKHKIALDITRSSIDKNILKKLSIILSIFLFFIIFEYFANINRIQEVESLRDDVFTKYKLQSTVLQNKSTLKIYKKIDLKQSKIRKYFSAVLTLKLYDNEKIVHIGLKDKNFVVKFKNISNNRRLYIQKFFKNKNIIALLNLSNTNLNVEMKL